MSYDKLVEALRECGERFFCNDCPIFETCDGDIDRAMHDAADAIEALNRLVELNTERCECLREQLRKAQDQYEKRLNELEQQLPKRGEWVYNDGDYIPYCSICGMPQDTETPYCYYCGAKMEVQDG